MAKSDQIMNEYYYILKKSNNIYIYICLSYFSKTAKAQRLCFIMALLENIVYPINLDIQKLQV